MNLTRFFRSLMRHRHVPHHKKFESYTKTLSPGDIIIFTGLIVLLIISTIFVIGSIRNSVIETVPAQGGTLTEGVIGSPRFINPLLDLSDTDRDLVELIYAGLMTVDENGDIVPELAKNFTLSEDGKTYTFTLKDNLVFQDGSTITSDDIIFTINLAQNPVLKSPRLADWKDVRVEKIDNKTVSFTLSAPYAPFLENTTLGILPKHIWENVPVEEFPFSNLMIEPIGAGPFKVDSVSRNNSGILDKYELKSFSEYTLGEPYIQKIIFKFFGNEKELADSFRKSDVDSTHSLVPEQFARDSFGVISAPYSRIFAVFLNQNENQVLTNLEVRKALSMVVDRDLIITNVLSGKGTVLSGPLPDYVVPTEISAKNNDQQLSDAIAMLERNDWKFDLEDRVWKKKKESIRITLRTSNVPELAAGAEIIKTNWEALGVPVALEFYEPSDLNQNVIRPRNYQALLFGEIIGRIPDLYAFWHSSQRNDPGLNIALYTDIQSDKLLTEARIEPDQRERVKLFEEIQQGIVEEVPAVFLYTPAFVYLVPEELKGVSLPPIITTNNRFAGVQKWYRETEKVWPFFIKINN